jgi:hypothetical protein
MVTRFLRVKTGTQFPVDLLGRLLEHENAAVHSEGFGPWCVTRDTQHC